MNITNYNMEEKFSLIVPMINTSKKYENSVPIEFQYDNESGKINCIKSIEGLNLEITKANRGAFMKALKGKVDMKIANLILEEMLKG